MTDFLELLLDGLEGPEEGGGAPQLPQRDPGAAVCAADAAQQAGAGRGARTVERLKSSVGRPEQWVEAPRAPLTWGAKQQNGGMGGECPLSSARSRPMTEDVLARSVEAAEDALPGGQARTSRWDGSQDGAGDPGMSPALQTPVNMFAGAAVLAQRLSQSTTWTLPAANTGKTAAAPAAPDTGLALEELDRRVQRDARRYDGLLTPY